MGDTFTIDVIVPSDFHADVFLSKDVVVDVTLAGPPGPAGASGSGLNPIAYAVTAVPSWSRSHPFPYYPDVRLVDATGEAVEIAVEYPSSTSVSISFPVPFTGTIILS